MRQYELTYLVSDKVSEADLNKVTGLVAGHIAEDGGKVLKEEIWKRRKLAYPIKKQEYATYVSLNFELSGTKVNSLDRQIRLTREIIRHLLIVKDYGKEELTLTSDEIAGTKDIEAVIGGEKSFEVVEGETKESKGLMAIRESSSDEATEKKEVSDTEEKQEAEIKKPEETGKSEEAEEKAVEEKKAKEPAKESKKPRAKKPKAENEADRLAKLDEELDNILKDEL